MKGKHSGAITSVVVVKKFDKFVVGSADQSVSLWRLLYNASNTQFENTYCEAVVSCGLGVINTLHVLGNGFVVAANLEGQLKLVNLVTQQVCAETDPAKSTTPIVDMLVAEEQRSKGSPTYFSISLDQFCVMCLGQSQKSLRFWKIQQKDDWWTQQEHKVDVALSLGDNMCRSKLQFVHMH